MVTREEHTVLGKNRMASGREEAFKAYAVRLGSNQEGSVLLAMFLRSRPCSDSLSALPMSVYVGNLVGSAWSLCGLGQSAHMPYSNHVPQFSVLAT